MMLSKSGSQLSKKILWQTKFSANFQEPHTHSESTLISEPPRYAPLLESEYELCSRWPRRKPSNLMPVLEPVGRFNRLQLTSAAEVANTFSIGASSSPKITGSHEATDNILSHHL